MIFFTLFSWIEDDIFEKIKHLTSKIINTSFSFVKILPLPAYDSSSADYYTSMRLVKVGEGAAEAVSGLDSSFKTFFTLFFRQITKFHVEFIIFSVALEKGHLESDPYKFTEVANGTFSRVQFLDRAQESF